MSHNEMMLLSNFLSEWGPNLMKNNPELMNQTLNSLKVYLSPCNLSTLLNHPNHPNPGIRSTCVNYLFASLSKIGCSEINQVSDRFPSNFKNRELLDSTLQTYLQRFQTAPTLKGFLIFLVETAQLATWRDFLKLIQPAPFDLASPIATVAPTGSKATKFYGPIEYNDEYEIIETLRNYLDYCFNLFHTQDSRYYSPYVVICQSSGYGKTRLCVEAGQCYVVFYVCGRSARSTGEPAHTAAISDYIKKENNPNLTFWTVLIHSMIYVYYFDIAKHVDNGESYQWLNDTIFNKDVQNEFWQKVIKLHLLLMNKMPQVSEDMGYRKMEGYLQNCFEDINYDIDIMNQETYLQNLPNLLETYVNENPPAKEQTFDLSALGSSPPFKRQSRSLFAKFKYNISQQAHILLVIDEASYFFIGEESTIGKKNPSVEELQSQNQMHPALSYIYFRRALRCIDQISFPMMTVLLDTNSRVANFAPEKSLDRSSRVAQEGALLFSPFHFFPKDLKILDDSFPLISASYAIARSPSSIITYKCCWSPFVLAKNSRVLFAAIAYDMIQNYNRKKKELNVMEGKFYKKVTKLAMDKLINSSLDNDGFLASDSFRTGNGLFAIAACRYYLSSTVEATQEVLVQQHLASILDISEDRKKFRIAYPSEPIIAEAALQLSLRSLTTHQKLKRSVFCYVLEKLKAMLMTEILVSSSGKGEIGELLACIIFSRAYDMTLLRLTSPTLTRFLKDQLLQFHTYNPQLYTKPIPLFRMLSFLFSQREYQILVESMTGHYQTAFFYALLQFNHFIKVEYSVKKEHLRYYLLRSAAIVCVNGEAGIDIIIPIAIPLDPNLTVNLEDESTYKISAIIIQVKNWKNDYDIEDLATKISTSTLATSIGFNTDSADQLFFIINVGAGKCAKQYRDKPCLQLKVVTSEQSEVEVSVDHMAQDLIKTKIDFYTGEKQKSHCYMTRQNKRLLELSASALEPTVTTVSNERRVIICQKFNITQENYRFLEPEELEILQEIQTMDPWQSSAVEMLKRIGRSAEYIERLTNNMDTGKNPPV